MSRVTFTIGPEQRAEADLYAQARGLGSVSNLARFAMFQLMARYPANGRKHVRRAGVNESDGTGPEGAAEVLPGAQVATSGAAEVTP